MNSLINFYNGKIIHQRLGKVEHKFINLHLFLLINITKIKSCNLSYISGKVRLLSINKFFTLTVIGGGLTGQLMVSLLLKNIFLEYLEQSFVLDLMI